MSDSPAISRPKLSPILKWAGGKERELKYIIPNLPERIANYYEPFVGGGAVYMAVEADGYFINDRSEELISLYKNISGSNKEGFFKAVEAMIHNWNLLTKFVERHDGFFTGTYKNYAQDRITGEQLKQALTGFIIDNAGQFNGMFSEAFNFNTTNFLKELQINIFRKSRRMKALEQQKHTLPDHDIADNMETALKSAYYMHFRHMYNHTAAYKIPPAIKSAIFFFIRNFAYGGMFRYNAAGHFNVPYGGIGYNRKNLQKKADYLRSGLLQDHLRATTINNLDFGEFLKTHNPADRDFIFLDPPYDSEFSTYAKNEFTKADQERLAGYLLNGCTAKWMLVIKNTALIRELYFDKGLNIRSFDKTYLVSFMNRNDRNAEHLLITNY